MEDKCLKDGKSTEFCWRRLLSSVAGTWCLVSVNRHAIETFCKRSQWMGALDREVFAEKLDRWRKESATIKLSKNMMEPMWIRLFWALGFQVPPPLFWRPWKLLLVLLIYNSLIWLVLMWPLYLLTPVPWRELLPVSLMLATFTALFHSMTYRLRADKSDLKLWSDY
jgi:hypothetical protein